MSTSQTTVLDVRQQLGWLVSNDDIYAKNFLRNLNLARQRIIQSGRWKGCVVETVFNGSTGYITLPPHMASIEGVTLNGCPTISFTKDYPYAVYGPGTLQHVTAGLGFLIDAGDHWVTSVDHIAGQQLRFVISNPEDVNPPDNEELIIRIFGEDSNGNELYDGNGFAGMDLKITSATQVFTPALNKFTGFQKPQLRGTMEVQSWDGANATTLQVYQPWETRPRYKRYRTGTYPSDKPIGCQCRLRYTPVCADTDFVIPDNLNAIELAMQAIDCQHSRDYQGAQAAWNICYNILNQEYANLRGKSIPTLTIIGPGQSGACRNSNFYIN